MPRNYIKKGGHGGVRRGAGRKRADNRRAERYSKRFSIMPLDYMLSQLNGLNPLTGKPLTGKNRPSAKRMDRMAIAAARFIHPRVAPVRLEETEPKPECALDPTKLTDEELTFLERILAKGQVRVVSKEEIPQNYDYHSNFP